MLQPRHYDYVTQEEMTERLHDVLKLYLKQKDEDMSFFLFFCLFVFFCASLTSVSLYNQGAPVWITEGKLCRRSKSVS